MVYIGIGSNLGDRRDYLRRAISEIGARVGSVVAVSPVYETAAWGSSATEPLPYLNAAIAVEVRLTPEQVLRTLLDIEQDLGRTRSHPNAPRTIDLDLLFYGSELLATDELTLPHPRLHLRRFVLRPMIDIAPHLLHPVLGADIATLYVELDDALSVNLYEA